MKVRVRLLLSLILLLNLGCHCAESAVAARESPDQLVDSGAMDASPDAAIEDGGVEAPDASLDGGAPSTQWRPAGGPLGGTLVLVGPIGNDLYAWPASGTVFHSNNAGRTWDEFEWATWGLSGIIQGLFEDVVELGAGSGRALISTLGGFYETSDRGRTWSAAVSDAPRVAPKGLCRVEGRYYAAMQTSPSVSEEALYRSDDAVHWTPLYTSPTGIAGFFIASDVALVVPRQRQWIARSTDGGTHWTEVPAPQASTGTYTRFADHGGAIYSSFGDGSTASIQRSDDRGRTWSVHRAGEIFQRVANASGVIYAIGSTSGWMRLSSDGRDWEVLSPRLGNLGLVAVGAEALASTAELGIYRVAPSGGPVQASPPAAGLAQLAERDGVILAATASGKMTFQANQEDTTSWKSTFGPNLAGSGRAAVAFRGDSFLLAQRSEAGGLAPSLYSSRDLDLGWSALGPAIAPDTAGDPPFGDVSALASAGATVLVGLSGGVSRSPSLVHALSGGLYRSIDGGVSFARVTAGIPDQPDGSKMLPPDVLAVASFENGIALASVSTWNRSAVERYDNGDNGIFRSTDGGEHWAFVANLADRDRVTHITRFITGGGNEVYALSQRRVFQSRDQGSAWIQLPLAGVAPNDLVDLTVVGGVLALAVANDVYLSHDGGQTFVSSGLPLPIERVTASRGRLYAATRSGVYWLDPR